MITIFLKDNMRSVVEALKKAVMALHFKGWIFFRENYMLVLIDAVRTKESFDDFLTGLESHLRQHVIRGCVSDSFDDLSFLYMWDRKNRRALDYVEYFNDKKPALIQCSLCWIR